jgi:ABC-2 type transport system permease protein
MEQNMFSIIKLRFLRLRDDYLPILLLTAMALGLTAIFGASDVDSYKPRVLVINEDQGKYSQLFIDELKTNSTFQYEMSDYNTAIKLVDEGEALTAFILNSDFSKNIDMGNAPGIEILKIKEDRYIFTLENIMSNISNKMITNIKISEVTANYISSSKNIHREEMVSRIYSKAKESWKYKKPVDVKKQMINVEGTRSYNHLKHMMIGFAIFFSTYTAVFSIGTILNDRQYNIWQRMLISPISKFSLLGGSMVAAYIIGVIQLSVLILGGKYLFNIDWGSSILGIIMIAGTFVFTITALGLLLSGIVKTYSQLSAITPVVLTSTAMLGGCMWPLDIINSKVLLTIANFVPQKWAVEGMEKIAVAGYGFEAAIMPSVILLGMGMVFFMIGVKLVKV